MNGKLTAGAPGSPRAALRFEHARRPSLSDIVLPHPPRQNPLRAEVERIVRTHALEAGLLGAANARRFDAFNTIAGYVFPRADLERLVVCSQWLCLLFVIDDHFDEGGASSGPEPALSAALTARLDVLRRGAPDPSAPAYTRMALRARDELARLGGPGWFARFCTSAEEYLLVGVARSVRAARGAERRTVEQYAADREYDSGAYTGLDLVEVATGLELPARVREHASVREMRRLCTRHLAFVNDLVSFGKELPAHGDPSNLVHLLMAERALSFDDAAAEVVRVVNADMRAFLELEAALPSWGLEVDRAARAYVAGMHDWMRGNVDWSLSTPRYATAGNPFPELRPAQPDHGS